LNAVESRNAVSQRLETGAVSFVDEVIDGIEHMLQFGLGERSPSRRNRIVGRVLRSVPLEHRVER
jgi:hypothetical protein